MWYYKFDTKEFKIMFLNSQELKVKLLEEG